MKLKVYKKTGQLLLELREHLDGIELVVVNSDGERVSRGTILNIDIEGLHLKRNINRDFGLPLDKEGMLKTKCLGSHECF